LLIAGFKIVNHGNAPAIIKSVKATLFYGVPEHHKDAFPVRPLPGTMMDFPTGGQLGMFNISHARQAVEKVGALPTVNLKPVEFERGIVIPKGENSQEFLFRGDSSIDLPPNDGIPIEHSGDIYLIGTVAYTTPNEEMEFLHFCYEAGNAIMPFVARRGPPFNERRKA
jgi:hypothetical protein